MNLFLPSIKTDAVAQQLVREWIAALRSGRYKQGQGALRDENDGHCCLGVFCDLIDPHGWSDETAPTSLPDVRGRSHRLGADQSDGLYADEAPIYYLDLETASKLHLDLAQDAMSRLGELNDGRHQSRRKTFKEVARKLENDLKRALA